MRVNWLLALCLFTLTVSAHAAGTTLSLSQWINNHAGPELTEKLSRHPKFKGQRLQFGPMQHDRPSAHSNGLIRQITNELTHQALAAGSNDIVTTGAAQCRQTTDVDYYIGVALHAQGNNIYRVDLRAFSPNAQQWVSGIAYSWRGRLSRAEQQAMASQQTMARPGSLSQPLNSLHSPTLPQLVVAQLACSALWQLGGSIYIASPDRPELIPALAQVADLARQKAGPSLAASPAADWHLQTHTQEITPGVTRVYLKVVAGKDNASDREDVVAQWYVQAAAVVATDPQPSHPAPPAATQPMPVGGLLGPIKQVRDRECRDCHTFDVTVTASAHMLIFSTIDNSLVPFSCTRPVSLRQEGQYRFRLRKLADPATPARPRAGLYVVASRDEQLIHHLGRQLVSAAGNCNPDANDTVPAQFIQAIGRVPDKLDWQAIHLTHAKRG